jgi:zinc protease
VKRAALLIVALAACGGTTTPPPQPPPDPPVPVQPTEPEARPPPQPGPPQVTQTAQPQELAFPDEAFRAEQPKPSAPRPFRLPKIKPFDLKNGIKVYLVEQHTLPIVSIDISFDGGSMTDPVGKQGLASVCMSMMSEGTEALDKIAYAEALADVAASIDSYAGGDTQGVSLSTLTKHLDTVFPIYVDTILKPGFRAEDLDRMIKRRLEALKQAKGSASSIAGRINGPVLYGEAHPFGRIVTEASLGAITLDDCRAYHAKWVKPKGARMFVVGDLTEKQIRERFDGEALKAWKGKVPKLPALPAPKAAKGRIFFVNVPGAKQSEISVLHFGPKRTAKDFFETMVMSSVLGGGFASRINMNLREDKGYSYGARAGFAYSRYYGTFGGSSSVVSESTYQALLEMKKEIDALRTGKAPATTDELTREKTGAIQSLPGRFATASASLSTFRSLVYYSLPLDYYGSFVTKLDKVTAKQVAAAAKKHLKPGEAVYLVVGDGSVPVVQRPEGSKKDEPLLKEGKPVTLLDSLRDLAASGALGKGDLVILDADAHVVTP